MFVIFAREWIWVPSGLPRAEFDDTPDHSLKPAIEAWRASHPGQGRLSYSLIRLGHPEALSCPPLREPGANGLGYVSDQRFVTMCESDSESSLACEYLRRQNRRASPPFLQFGYVDVQDLDDVEQLQMQMQLRDVGEPAKKASEVVDLFHSLTNAPLTQTDRSMSDDLSRAQDKPVASEDNPHESPPKVARTTDEGPALDVGGCQHNEDFTWVMWHGTEYSFKKGQQAAAVAALWTEWERGGKRDGVGLSNETICEKVGATTSFKLPKLFRRRGESHPALGGMIRQVSKGVYALFSPQATAPGESPENPR